MPPTNETVIPFSRRKLGKLFSLSVACILLGLFFLILWPHEPGILLTLPVIAILIGAFILVATFLLSTFYVRQILKNGPGMIIDSNGFTDFSSGLAAGYIPWTEVRGIKIVTVSRYKRRLISIVLNDPNAFLQRQPNALKRKAMTLNLRSYGSPIQLSDRSLHCSFDELHHHLQTYFDRSRPAVLN